MCEIRPDHRTLSDVGEQFEYLLSIRQRLDGNQPKQKRNRRRRCAVDITLMVDRTVQLPKRTFPNLGIRRGKTFEIQSHIRRRAVCVREFVPRNGIEPVQFEQQRRPRECRRQFIGIVRMSAVSLGVDVVHGAVTGRTTIIRADGSVARKTDQFEATLYSGVVRFQDSPRTLYAIAGDWLQILAMAAGLIALVGFGEGRRGFRVRRERGR